MQAPVSFEAIRAFMPTFFTELCRDGAVDRAVAAARSALQDGPEWWIPVLFLRAHSGNLWEVIGANKQRF
jgi:hypothetical protein